jgi:hypothetical protein
MWWNILILWLAGWWAVVCGGEPRPGLQRADGKVDTWFHSPGEQSPLRSATLGCFSHRLLLDHAVILACPAVRPACTVISKIFRNKPAPQIRSSEHNILKKWFMCLEDELTIRFKCYVIFGFLLTLYLQLRLCSIGLDARPESSEV